MNLDELLQTIRARVTELTFTPTIQFYGSLDEEGRRVFFVLIAVAATAGFILGARQVRPSRRRRSFRIGRRGFSTFQNDGEALVSGLMASAFGPPDYHLMNHVTLRMDDGTTQVDHILISRFGVFVIETKHYTGWLFGDEAGPTWTQVRYEARFQFQNPIFQNARHVRAVRELLDFLPPDAIKSLVVFTGDAEFKTDMPRGVILIDQLADYVRQHNDEIMSLNRLQFCVGRLETARLAISGETDLQHIQSLARRHGAGAK